MPKTKRAIGMPVEQIIQTIAILRGHRVLLDAELAALYGVTTKALNQAVKRNSARFPEDFIFRLSAQETEALNRSQIVTGSQKHRDPRFPPYAFTEHGAIMAASILNSPRAIEMSVYVVRAFVQLRELLASNTALARKLDELECKYKHHDVAIAGSDAVTGHIIERLRRAAIQGLAEHPQVRFLCHFEIPHRPPRLVTRRLCQMLNLRARHRRATRAGPARPSDSWPKPFRVRRHTPMARDRSPAPSSNRV